MPESEKPPELAGLEARLKEAEARQAAAVKPPDERGKGLALAFRISAELVGGLIVGVGIGWLLDRWLGTKPWLLIVFFLLGSAAGLVSVMRTVSGMGHGVGYRPAPGKPGKGRAPDKDGKETGP
jgi:ATP synthase protein I